MSERVLIIVPAYNESAVIAETVNQLEQFCNSSNQFDYIVINDGSRDDTEQILKQRKANYITHPINLGIGEPYKTGIKYGLRNGYSRFINFDADGQHRLDNLYKVTEVENYDYVVGSRFATERKPYSFRMVGSRLLVTAIRIRCGLKVTDPTSGLVLINNQELAKYYISHPANKPEPSIYPRIYKNYSIKEIQVEMEERAGGQSYFNLYNSLHFMLEQLFMIILKG